MKLDAQLGARMMQSGRGQERVFINSSSLQSIWKIHDCGYARRGQYAVSLSFVGPGDGMMRSWMTVVACEAVSLILVDVVVTIPSG